MDKMFIYRRWGKMMEESRLKNKKCDDPGCPNNATQRIFVGTGGKQADLCPRHVMEVLEGDYDSSHLDGVL